MINFFVFNLSLKYTETRLCLMSPVQDMFVILLNWREIVKSSYLKIILMSGIRLTIVFVSFWKILRYYEKCLSLKININIVGI